jgi:hypothetical protein
MPLERRQLMLGAASVVALGLAAWTLWPSTPAPTAPAQTAARARNVRAGAPAQSGPVGPVRLTELTASRDDPRQAGRNPFRFQPKAAPPPPPPTPSGREVIEAPRPPEPTGPPPPRPVPPIALKLIGVLERANGVKWAVLSDGKSAPMYGKDGDIIDGRYLIVKIGTESIEMTHADGKGRQVIRLTGQ